MATQSANWRCNAELLTLFDASASIAASRDLITLSDSPVALGFGDVDPDACGNSSRLQTSTAAVDPAGSGYRQRSSARQGGQPSQGDGSRTPTVRSQPRQSARFAPFSVRRSRSKTPNTPSTTLGLRRSRLDRRNALRPRDPRARTRPPPHGRSRRSTPVHTPRHAARTRRGLEAASALLLTLAPFRSRSSRLRPPHRPHRGTPPPATDSWRAPDPTRSTLSVPLLAGAGAWAVAFLSSRGARVAWSPCWMRATTTESRVGHLNDARPRRPLLNLTNSRGRFGDAIDHRDLDRLGRSFTDDAVFDLTDLGVPC